MRKKLVFFFIFISLLIFNFYLIIKLDRQLAKEKMIGKILSEISPIKPDQQFNSSPGPAVLGTYQTNIELSDNRVANLKSFFRKYNSPLFDYAEHIVATSDKYKFDYRLLPAIAMQESNLCKYIPENSYNCWGWGIYGDTVTRFESYNDAIDVVALGLKTHYLDKGLVTASAIMEKYTPSSNGSWQRGVNTFIKMLD